MPLYRFFIPIIPLMMGIIVIAAFNIPHNNKFVHLVIVVSLLFLGVRNLNWSLRFLPQQDKRLSSQLKVINPVNWLSSQDSLYLDIVNWIQANVQENEVIAVGDIGYIGYFTSAKIIDVAGLTDAHIAHIKGRSLGKTDLIYVLNRKPDYIITMIRKNLLTGDVKPLSVFDKLFYKNRGKIPSYKNIAVINSKWLSKNHLRVFEVWKKI